MTPPRCRSQDFQIGQQAGDLVLHRIALEDDQRLLPGRRVETA